MKKFIAIARIWSAKGKTNQEKRVDKEMEKLLAKIDTEVVGDDTRVILFCAYDYGEELPQGAIKAIKDRGPNWQIRITPNFEALGKIVASGKVAGLVIMNADEPEEDNVTMDEPLRSPYGQVARKQISYFARIHGEEIFPPVLLQKSSGVNEEELRIFLANLK